MYVSFLFLDLLINLDETCYINWLGYQDNQHLYSFWELYL